MAEMTDCTNDFPGGRRNSRPADCKRGLQMVQTILGNVVTLVVGFCLASPRIYAWAL
jgi:hypothetical protein